MSFCTEKHGTYTKAEGEDERSMWTGLVGQKGKVHLEFGHVLPWQGASEEVKPERTMALQFDEASTEACAWPNQRLGSGAFGMVLGDVCPCARAHTKRGGNVVCENGARVEDDISALGWSKGAGVAEVV